MDPSPQQVVVEVAVNTLLHKDQEAQVDLAVVELEMEVLLILVELVILHLFHLHKEIMVEQDLILEVIISLLVAEVVPVVLVVMDLVQTLVVLVVLDHQLRSKPQLLNFMLVVAVELVKAVVVLVILVEAVLVGLEMVEAGHQPPYPPVVAEVEEESLPQEEPVEMVLLASL